MFVYRQFKRPLCLVLPHDFQHDTKSQPHWQHCTRCGLMNVNDSKRQSNNIHK